jgi:hypothetical protein
MDLNLKDLLVHSAVSLKVGPKYPRRCKDGRIASKDASSMSIGSNLHARRVGVRMSSIAEGVTFRSRPGPLDPLPARSLRCNRTLRVTVSAPEPKLVTHIDSRCGRDFSNGKLA